MTNGSVHGRNGHHGKNTASGYLGLLPISCATAIYLIGQMVLITYVPLYLKDVMDFSAYWASQALALTQGGAMVGRTRLGYCERPPIRRAAQNRLDL